MNNYQFAYISRLIYPDPAANALQTIQMAAALARQTGNTHLFVHDLAQPEAQIRRQYAVDGTPLQIWPMRVRRWPAPLYHSMAGFMIYNSAIAAILSFHPTWRRRQEQQKKIVYVRSRLEFLYWGLMRPYFPHLRNWLFVFEAHDLQFLLQSEGSTDYQVDSPRVKRAIRAFQNYDLVLAVTKALAEDIEALTQGRVEPEVARLSTGLERLARPPAITLASKQVVLGYVGTIDLQHGIADLFQAVRLLPENYKLRLVGRVHKDAKAWLEQWAAEPSLSSRFELVGPVSYAEVAVAIDGCDIALLPAGETDHADRYRSPLKLFDYMARGKPIVAAGVPCHLELVQDGVNASIYQRGKAKDLAARIMSLTQCPQQLETIARTAWEQSANYTYQGRAKHILDLMDQVWERRQIKSPKVRR